MCKHSAAANEQPEAQVPTTAPPAAPGAARFRRNKQPSHRLGARQQQQQQQRGQTDADGYAAAQERVRQLLISADMNNPQAAAAALPDTVNDIVIALQLLATAPKPPGLTAAKRYDAAVQQLAAAVVHKFKQLLLKGQQQEQQHRQQHGQQQQQQHLYEVSLAPHHLGGSSSSSSGSSGSSTHLPNQPTGQSAAAAAAAADQEMQFTLAGALAGLPGTKLAAAAFSLGVLHHYDTQLVPALEQGSLLLLLSSSSSSSGGGCIAADARTAAPSADKQQQQQQQQQQQKQLQSRPPRFNANQLGQLAQGFVYLDHELSPAWQAAFLQACRKQIHHMKPPQLASIAEFLLRYRLGGNSSSSSRVDTGRLLAQLSSTSRLLSSSSSSSAASTTAVPVWGNSGSTSAVAAITAAGAGTSAAAAAAAGLGASDITWQLYSGWSEVYLSAAARQAYALKPQLLVPVLQAAAVLYQQHMQLQGAKGLRQPQLQQPSASSSSFGGAGSTTSNKQRRRLAVARVFGELPVAMPDAQQAAAAGGPDFAGHDSSSSSGDSSGKAWLLPLLLSFQQQLADMKMQHLAAALPALAQLTVLPWPGEVAELLLLQLRLLLPSASGLDAVTAAAAAACLAPAGAIAADRELSTALLQRLHAVMPTLGPGGIAAAIQTLAVLQVKPYRAWVYELCARLRVEARSMSMHEVLAVLEGLATLRVQIDPEVLHRFVLGVQRGLGVMSSSELRRTVAALRGMYPRVLPGRSVAQLVEEMERRAAVLELQEVAGH
jgi:hypothetical protein